jgi:hypothetical protein
MSRVAEPMHRHAAVAIEEWLRHREQAHDVRSTQRPARIPERPLSPLSTLGAVRLHESLDDKHVSRIVVLAAQAGLVRSGNEFQDP